MNRSKARDPNITKSQAPQVTQLYRPCLSYSATVAVLRFDKSTIIPVTLRACDGWGCACEFKLWRKSNTVNVSFMDIIVRKGQGMNELVFLSICSSCGGGWAGTSARNGGGGAVAVAGLTPAESLVYCTGHGQAHKRSQDVLQYNR